MTPAPHWSDALLGLGACQPAVDWAATQPDLATAWRECDRGDWMLWLWATACPSEPMSDARKPVVACCCDIGSAVLPVFESRRPGDDRPRAALALLRRWLSGDTVSAGDLRAAADAAADAAYAERDAASAAASSAAEAASAADAGATYAASASASAAAASARLSADIVRRNMPTPTFTLEAP